MLQQADDPTSPGLWTDPSWTSGPATFAVVIGVSRYAHLAGDDQSYGLGQLYVSATSAHRFFQWLQCEYRYTEKPLAGCWLLLAPSDAELACGGLPETPAPSFQNCQAAIEQWYASLQRLNAVHAEESRSVFFFSGHGIELTQDQQILLPTDYLRPPVRNVNWALSTSNLYYGLQQLPVPEHLFFIDACRSDYDRLRETKLRGTAILNEASTYGVARAVDAPIVYATGPGASAWQPTDPGEGSSVFSTALIEGLEGPSGVPPTAQAGRHWVTLLHLEDYLAPRVRTLLQAAGSRVRQPVQFGGRFNVRALVCEVTPPALEPPAEAAPQDAFAYVAGDDMDMAVDLEQVGRPPETVATAAGAADELETLPLGSWTGPSKDEQWSGTCNLVGNEFMTSLLWDAELCNLQTGVRRRLRDADARRWVTIRGIRRHPSREAYEVDVQLEHEAPTWLAFRDVQEDARAACTLLGDSDSSAGVHRRPLYTLKLDLEQPQGGPARITGLDVVLSKTNEAVIAQAADLWDRFRMRDIEEDVTPAEAALMEAALQQKLRSPLAATVAALLLLRAWRESLLHQWLGNLASWFPERPDPCVLRAEQLLRAGGEKAAAEVVPLLRELERRGLPQTAETLGHAVRQTRNMLQFGSVSETDKRALRQLEGRLSQALAVFRPGGLCVTFVGRGQLVRPELMLP